MQNYIKFREYFRVNIAQFYYLLNVIKPHIEVPDTKKYLNPISAQERLAMLPRYVN